jgi:hypothetical protein
VTAQASRRTPIDDLYRTCERTRAMLKIYGKNLDPAAVTSALRLDPSGTQRMGDVRTGAGGIQSRPCPVGGWFLSSEGAVESKDVRRHLDWLLAHLLPKKRELEVLQQQPGVTMGVDCVWWSAAGQGGPTLWPEQMRVMADLNLECSFDVAFFGEPEEEHGPSAGRR